MSRTLAFVLCLLSGALLLGARQSTAAPATQNPPQAQSKRPNIPDTYTNLKVLPKDIKKQDLVAIMKAFCIERKIRCSQCHAVNDELTEGDFTSDEKPTKVAAREMLRTLFETRAKYPLTFPAPETEKK